MMYPSSPWLVWQGSRPVDDEWTNDETVVMCAINCQLFSKSNHGFFFSCLLMRSCCWERNIPATRRTSVHSKTGPRSSVGRLFRSFLIVGTRTTMITLMGFGSLRRWRRWVRNERHLIPTARSPCSDATDGRDYYFIRFTLEATATLRRSAYN